jgi:oxalate decarboxylase/phosphoglucose isomerase-like protein (cupin superfamily)
MKYFKHVDEIEDWMDTEKAVYYTGGDRKWLKDKLIWQRLFGPEDSNDLIFGIAKLPPGEEHLLHHHEDAPELYFVLEGRGVFMVNEEVRDCTPGTGIYMPAGSRHSVKNHGDKMLIFFFAYDRPQYETTLDAR